MHVKMNSESALIKAVCRKIVYNSDDNRIESLLKRGQVDWRSLQLLLEYHELAPFFYLKLKDYKRYPPKEQFQYLSEMSGIGYEKFAYSKER